MIEKFVVPKDRNGRPDILQGEEFAPAVVPDNNIGVEAQFPEAAGGRRDAFRAADRLVQLSNCPMNVVRSWRRTPVGDFSYTRHDIFVGLCDKHDFVLVLQHQVPNQVQELSRKVLVHK